ncbi:MAG: YraN family protein [Candidatus Omnitrophica bacterium]|nr:YraN family protein [Candidatus Omnitrophota bacterium]
MRQRRGQVSERLARAYLRRQGYQIEATNVRFPIGELDLIALEGDTLCVIEVRSKASEAYGSALESITDRKRQHLIRAAQWYLQRRRPSWTGAVRFDVLAIHHESRRQPTMQLIRGAFTSD